MSRYLKTLLVAGLAGGAGACSDFLGGDKLDTDPNRPTSAQAAQLFTAAQVNSYYIVNGHAARVLAMWVQQMAGTDRQYTGYDQYAITEGLFGEYSGAYTGGGLIDLRSIIADATASGNKTLAGISKVWEALVMSFVADMYGDAPYSEAVRQDITTPVLDPQVQIYAALQTLLDGALADLNAGQGSVGALDLSLGGDRLAWVRVARTLKARLFLHTAEVTPGAYALALAQAQQGINDATGAHDLNEYHSDAAGEENIWWQFIARDRDSYTRPGKVLVDLMKARNDPRLPDYFELNDAGQYGGAAPGEGLDPTKHSNISAVRLNPSFAQPIITWAENQAIIAETQYRGGNAGAARDALNALRTSFGLPNVSATLSGPALLTAILEEKYIALFQNYEAYNDYKRTCYPNITAASNAYQGNVPARFTYPVGERTSNPNVPLPANQPRRNTNDPPTANAPDGVPCRAQRP